jgi:hypothetical protein
MLTQYFPLVFSLLCTCININNTDNSGTPNTILFCLYTEVPFVLLFCRPFADLLQTGTQHY